MAQMRPKMEIMVGTPGMPGTVGRAVRGGIKMSDSVGVPLVLRGGDREPVPTLSGPRGTQGE